MKFRATLFFDASARNSASASFSLFAFGNSSGRSSRMFFEAQLAQHLCDFVRARADMTINESSDGVWRRDEVTRCRFFLRFCYRFLNPLRLARMHCERLRSAMGAS